jgi:mitogen-activated protein kinase 1/3
MEGYKTTNSKGKEEKKSKRTFTISGVRFEIDERYEFIKQIGIGSYSTVCSCYDKKENRNVAIKKITNAFDDKNDARRVLREIKMLRFFDHDNLITLLEVPKPSNSTTYNDIYIITDLMETDLHRVIYSRQELTDDHIQYFIFQILRGTLFLHSANVVHRELKPANILANKNCDLKICDLGLDHGIIKDDDNTVQKLIDNPNLPVEISNNMIYDDSKRELTEKVIARWYRAPEIILNPNDYTKAVDVWSIGCIFAELLGRQPLFPSDNYLDELQKVISVLGSPSESDLEFITDEKVKNFVNKLARRTKQSFSVMFPTANPVALDLLGKMLTFSPNKRYNVEQCLSHPYFEGLHDPEQEPTSESTFNFSFDSPDLTKEQLRQLIYEQCVQLEEEN